MLTLEKKKFMKISPELSHHSNNRLPSGYIQNRLTFQQDLVCSYVVMRHARCSLESGWSQNVFGFLFLWQFSLSPVKFFPGIIWGFGSFCRDFNISAWLQKAKSQDRCLPNKLSASPTKWQPLPEPEEQGSVYSLMCSGTLNLLRIHSSSSLSWMLLLTHRSPDQQEIVLRRSQTNS